MLGRRLLPFFVGTIVVLGAGPAAAATLTVNTTGDDTIGGDGLCSLREAVQAVDSPGSASGDCAPAAFGPNTIVLGAHTYSLFNGSELTIAPTVTSLTIAGAGESKTTINARGLGNRVLENPAGARLTIENLTITGGTAPSGVTGSPGASGSAGTAGAPGQKGGAVLNNGALALIDAAITNSTAGSGGAGGSGGSSSPGAGGNGGNGGNGGDGGAIYNTGALTLQGATIAGNQAGVGGFGASGGQGTTNGGTGGAGGEGGNGAGVSNSGGTLIVNASTIRGNRSGAGGDGGNGGPGGSGAGGPGGGGGDASGGGGIFTAGGTASITNSTFASNLSGAGGAGGSGAPGATTGNGGGGGDGGGGGAAALITPASASLQSVTVAGNTAGAGGAGGSGATPGTPGGAGNAGGLTEAGSTTTVQNSLLASNSGGNCSGSILDGGHNLSFSGAGCPATFAGGDPNLGPLQDNGGPSTTVSLGSGSAAIDKVPSRGAGCPATDQRGVPRPSGSACDIGAYEVARPKASTGAATATTISGATVNGTVTPNAGDATVQFVFGTNTKYGSKTAIQHLGGVTGTLVLAKLKGLKPRTIYHYRVLVSAPDGSAAGADRTFTTSPSPALGKISIKPSTFRARGRGATVSYTDTKASKVTFVVLRAAKGIRRGKRCVAVPKHPGHARTCTRFVKVGSFTHTDHPGRNSLHLSGRLGRHLLAVGSYRLDATPRAARQAGKTLSIRLRIIA